MEGQKGWEGEAGQEGWRGEGLLSTSSTHGCPIFSRRTLNPTIDFVLVMCSNQNNQRAAEHYLGS